jgi:hypothetical protein
VAAVGIVALLALAASMALMQPATVAPKGGTAEGLGLKGVVEITVRDASGNVKHHEVIPNAIVLNGLEGMLENAFSPTGTPNVAPYKYMWFMTTKYGTNYVNLTAPEASRYIAFTPTPVTIVLEKTITGSDLGAVAGGHPTTVGYILIANATRASGTGLTLALSPDPPVKNQALTTFTIDSTDYSKDVFSAIQTSIELYAGDSLTVTWKITPSAA